MSGWCARYVPPLRRQPADRTSGAWAGAHCARVVKLRVILRRLLSFAVGVLMVVPAIRFGEALWRVVTSWRASAAQVTVGGA